MVFLLLNDRVTFPTRLVIIVVNLIAVPFLAIGVSFSYNFDTDGYGETVDGISLTPVCMSIFWTAIALILAARRVKYHPAIDLTLELICWGLGLGIVWILISWLVENGGYMGNGCLLRASAGACSNLHRRVLHACEIIAATMILVSITCHLLLFIKACRDTHVKRITTKKNRESFVELEETVYTGKA